MPDLPTGTVTFLFTDIEASTKRWEANPAAMQAAFPRQEAILRHAIEANGGYAYKMIGDAFQAAFPTAPQALQAAIDAQRALHSESWPAETGEVKVRMALHTGITEERGDDYVGPTLNRVARILSAGHGGQTLLSAATQELVRDYLPPGTTLVDLGERRLKDLFRPERIFQVTAPDVPSDFPPLRTLDSHPNNLPAQPTLLIGRERELAEVEKLLGREDVRLVTLTGPGGTGKSRLSLQVASNLIDDFPDGAWFVELATLEEADLVVPTIAARLGLREEGSTPILDMLTAYLKDKRLFLVLDNLEQVVGAARDVSALIAACPNLKVLATSRIPLHIAWEKEYPVPPLSTPDIHNLPLLEALSQYESVRLFIERATDVKPDFQVNNENAPAVAEICARLDGLPLAIELAAARIKLFSPQAILTRLSSRLKLLTGGARDRPARQQTLRGAIEWSYDLLEDGEKQLFRRMAPFSGGRTLEALEAVCNYDGQLLLDVVDGVQSLVDKSLLQQREGSEGEPRLWMLETIHEYAREKLQESGEGVELHREHALYFMTLAEQAEPELAGKKQVEWYNRLEEEHDNIRAALRRARESEDAEDLELGLRLGGAIWRFWEVRGYWSEGRDELQGLLARPTVVGGGKAGASGEGDVEPGEANRSNRGNRSNRSSSYFTLSKAKALHGAGGLAYDQGDYGSARTLLEESLGLFRRIGDKRRTALSLLNLGNVAYMEGELSSARSLYGESLSLFREVEDKSGMSLSLGNLGEVADKQGDKATARAMYEEGRALARETGNKRGLAWSLTSLGNLAYEQGDYAAARADQEESLALRRELGDKWGTAYSLWNLGNVVYMQEDLATARSLYEESLSLSREMGDKGGVGLCLNHLANVAYMQGDMATARRLYEEGLGLAREIGARSSICHSLAGLGEVAVTVAAAAAGHSIMPDSQGDSPATSEVVGMGRDQIGRGVRLLGAAEVLLEAMGTTLERKDRVPYEQAVALARSSLGEEAFDKATQEGRAMSMEQAIGYALQET